MDIVTGRKSKLSAVCLHFLFTFFVYNFCLHFLFTNFRGILKKKKKKRRTPRVQSVTNGYWRRQRQRERQLEKRTQNVKFKTFECNYCGRIFHKKCHLARHNKHTHGQRKSESDVAKNTDAVELLKRKEYNLRQFQNSTIKKVCTY